MPAVSYLSSDILMIDPVKQMKERYEARKIMNEMILEQKLEPMNEAHVTYTYVGSFLSSLATQATAVDQLNGCKSIQPEKVADAEAQLNDMFDVCLGTIELMVLDARTNLEERKAVLGKRKLAAIASTKS